MALLSIVVSPVVWAVTVKIVSDWFECFAKKGPKTVHERRHSAEGYLADAACPRSVSFR